MESWGRCKNTDQSECSKQYFGTKVTYSSKGKEANLQTLEVTTQSKVLGEIYRQTIETALATEVLNMDKNDMFLHKSIQKLKSTKPSFILISSESVMLLSRNVGEFYKLDHCERQHCWT